MASVETLAERLNHHSWSTRRDALNELVDGAAELRLAHKETMIVLLKDENNDMRAVAARALLKE